MSSKFNHKQKLQKTPPICKKQPPDLPDTLETFANYPLQAYASWRAWGSPITGLVVGQTTLHAFPDFRTHWGRIEQKPYSLEIELIFNPTTGTTSYTVSLFDRSGILDQRTRVFHEPRPSLPYEAGLFTWIDVPATSTVRSKAFS